jgi:hypothetical protein
MKLWAILLLLFLPFSVSAQVKVRGYTRKDGTVVSAYTRRSKSGSEKPYGGEVQTSEPRSDKYSVPRNSRGAIKRSMSARQRFMDEHPCPATGQTGHKCKGYVVDHIHPLACGGMDDPSNMQWQTTADGKAKDKWERKSCGK